MARSKTFANKTAIAKALREYESLSRFLKVQLVTEGYLEQIKVPEAKKVVGSRGRMPVHYQHTKAGRNLINLSKNWAAFREAATDAVVNAVTGGEQTEDSTQTETASA